MYKFHYRCLTCNYKIGAWRIQTRRHGRNWLIEQSGIPRIVYSYASQQKFGAMTYNEDGRQEESITRDGKFLKRISSGRVSQSMQVLKK